uniref:Uncharacterized protein n=1 Tax=Daphnia magna TaxID=35525 RepID=A0A0P5XQA2_9CRUS
MLLTKTYLMHGIRVDPESVTLSLNIQLSFDIPRPSSQAQRGQEGVDTIPAMWIIFSPLYLFCLSSRRIGTS